MIKEAQVYLYQTIQKTVKLREEINKGFLRNMDDLSDNVKNNLNSALYALDSVNRELAILYFEQSREAEEK